MAERWKKATGIPLVEANGLTETSPGAICLRSPQVMAGYWNHPDETALAFTREGWLRTGILGFMDERGWFKIIDRKKDMMSSRASKSSPTRSMTWSRRAARALPAISDGLQGAAIRRIQRPAAAQDRHRQGTQAPAA